MKDTAKTKDDIRRYNTAMQQKHRKKVKEMKPVEKTEKVQKTKEEIRADINKRVRLHRERLQTSTDVDILFINHKHADFVHSGLDSVRFNIEPRYNPGDRNGREIPKPDESECLVYFKKAKKVVELNVIEAIAKCLKKRLSDEKISLSCVNVLSALLHGEDWFVDEDEVTQKDSDALFEKIRNKIFKNDLVNVLFLFLQKLNRNNDNQHIIIPTMDVLACVLSRKHSLPLSMYVDASKEFEIVSAMEKQLAIEQRGHNSCMIVTHGCTILECFVVLYPNLSRNRTCCITETLFLKVYNLFYPYPYYMCSAAPVLELLLKNLKSADQFQRSALVIYKFVKKHNDDSARIDKPVIYVELQNSLFNILNKPN